MPPATELQQLVIDRAEAINDLREQTCDLRRCGVIGITSVEGGPNWTVGVVSDRDMHHGGIAQIIGRYRNVTIWSSDPHGTLRVSGPG